MSNLTFYERQKIEYLLKCRLKIRAIARLLYRDHSVISREVRRHKGQFFPYSAVIAQQTAERHARITNTPKLKKNERLREYVIARLKDGWSPEQIAGRLKRQSPSRLHGARISHEQIYQYIYAENNDHPWLYHYLRKAHPKRRKHFGRKTRTNLIKERVSIHEREDTAGIPGHWESDTLNAGRRSEGVSVHYHKTIQFARLHRLANHTAEETEKTLRATFGDIPAELRKTLTFDNGGEGANHTKIRDEYQIKTYFCDPYKSWQKGGVENLNGLIRQYIPKRADPSILTDEYIRAVENKLNNRPRRRLNYATPNEMMAKLINR